MAYWDAQKGELVDGPTRLQQKKIIKQLQQEDTELPAVRSQGQTLSEKQRIAAKLQFLDGMAKTNIISASCEHAQISYTTYVGWIRSGHLIQTELDEAFRRYQDMLRGEIAKIALVGVPKVIVHNGKIQVDKTGKQQTVNVRDPKILIELAKRYLPEWRDAPKEDAPASNADVSGIPTQYLLAIDARYLLSDEIAQIRTIAANIETRKQQQEQAVETTLVLS